MTPRPWGRENKVYMPAPEKPLLSSMQHASVRRCRWAEPPCAAGLRARPLLGQHLVSTGEAASRVEGLRLQLLKFCTACYFSCFREIYAARHLALVAVYGPELSVRLFKT